jgi:hypothetical protein
MEELIHELVKGCGYTVSFTYVEENRDYPILAKIINEGNEQEGRGATPHKALLSAVGWALADGGV